MQDIQVVVIELRAIVEVVDSKEESNEDWTFDFEDTRTPKGSVHRAPNRIKSSNLEVEIVIFGR